MATKKAAESTLYHLSPRGFWKKFRDAVVVNPEISSGLPLAELNRYPPPGSRPEIYSTPATKGASRKFVAPPAAEGGAVANAPKEMGLAEAIATITAKTKVYTESKLPPSLPTAYKRWVPEQSPDAPHPPYTYFPMSLIKVYFSKESNTWRYEEDDGTEMEYDAGKGAWLPLVDEDLMKQQQAAYSVSGVDEEASRAPAAPVAARANKKRKEPDYTSATPVGDGHSIKRGKQDKKDKPVAERKSKNTAIYVTGLPLDTEFDEVVSCFSKFGVLEEDDDGEPKVKMYARDDGSFSGDALVVYFKEDSVILALNILDESELRLGDPNSVMHLAKADFSHKNTSHSDGKSGESQPRKTVDKKKASRRIGKMQQNGTTKMASGLHSNPKKPLPRKTSRAVVLKHMFTLKELEEDATLLLDLKEDVRDECSSLGEVTNVVLYDKEEDGIMTVKFRDPVSAQACVLSGTKKNTTENEWSILQRSANRSLALLWQAAVQKERNWRRRGYRRKNVSPRSVNS
ncbi:hypothetical protein BDZ89DRAFT_1040878 [Hymenopellis radicata]|nr:hypothetical protein BDZ89DRAFT_1040878 [Hymenopellis radicata]